MAAASLLEAVCFFKVPPKSRPAPAKFNPLLRNFPQCHFSPPGNPKSIRLSPQLALKPSLIAETPAEEANPNPFGGLMKAITETLETLKKPALAVVLLGFLLTVDPYSALAASGGRMGGRSFSSSSSSSSRSHSYSAPSGSFSYSVPYYAPSPFMGGGGLYAGSAFGVGVGAGSGLFLLMMGFAGVILLSGFLSDRSDDGSVLTATQKTTVLKLQVGLLGMARSFQKDLDRIAETADTSTSEGLNYVLTGIIGSS